MPLLLVALFILVPIAELAIIIQVGQALGLWWTIALLIADSVLGSLLMRSQGRAAWRRFTEAVQSGRAPARGDPPGLPAPGDQADDRLDARGDVPARGHGPAAARRRVRLRGHRGRRGSAARTRRVSVDEDLRPGAATDSLTFSFGDP